MQGSHLNECFSWYLGRVQVEESEMPSTAHEEESEILSRVQAEENRKPVRAQSIRVEPLSCQE